MLVSLLINKIYQLDIYFQKKIQKEIKIIQILYLIFI